jgi:glycosyltransferase involved in cell wall biosynthesis
MVTCVMITGKSPERRALAAMSAQCFLEQTYEDKRLVVLTTDPWLPPWYGDKLVRHVLLRQPDAPLGVLRNMGLDLCKPGYVMQWDDDDWSHPERIQWQMERTPPGQASVLQWEIRFSLARNAALVLRSQERGIPGTILHPWPGPVREPDKRGRDGWHTLPDMYVDTARRHEDSWFREAHFPDAAVIDNHPQEFPGPALHVRLYHGGNTWSERQIMKDAAGEQNRNRWRQVTGPHEDYLRGVVARYRKAGLVLGHEEQRKCVSD